MPNPHSQPEGASGRTEAIKDKLLELAHIADTDGEFSVDVIIAVQAVLDVIVTQLTALQQAVADAQKDTERLNWLAESASKRGPVNSYNVESPPLVAAIAYDPIHTLREAIDAARTPDPAREEQSDG